MGPTFRASMNLLHTWAGVTAGALLFAIFWMGTLSVFDREIDRWMMPSTRGLPRTAVADVDTLWKAQAPRPGATEWSVAMATERTPMVRIRERGADRKVRESWHHPVTGEKLPEAETLAGSEFLYPFHYNLHLKFRDIGPWIVGLAGMTMLAMLISGIVIHRAIFSDFFTFRPQRRLSRSVLDLHTVGGVVGLPFHVAITLSGLVIFVAAYFPSVEQVAYIDSKSSLAREAQGAGAFSRPKANRLADPMPIGVLEREALRIWGHAPFFVRVWNPGDANAYVEMRRSFDTEVALNRDALYFDAVTGTLLHRFSTAPIATAQRFISGLHSVRFRHWGLRWLYFGLGLVGCMTIATGYLFWLESRRKKHMRLALGGVRVVEGLTIGSITGIVTATLAFFVANRLLPSGAALAGYDRSALEIWIFYLVWFASFVHAWMRRTRAWTEQCAAIAVLAGAAVALNWVTTGDHLARTLIQGHLWAVASMDLLLLATAAVSTWAAHRLRRPSPHFSHA